MSKRYTPLAGACPQFNSTSVEITNRKARVTGYTITAVGNHALRTLHYETRAGKNGRTNNMAYQAECDCLPDGSPSPQILEDMANAYIYGSPAAAGKNARHYADNPSNRCSQCHVLLPRTGHCDDCDPAGTATTTLRNRRKQSTKARS
jgi:hypothetical protein